MLKLRNETVSVYAGLYVFEITWPSYLLKL